MQNVHQHGEENKQKRSVTIDIQFMTTCYHKTETFGDDHIKASTIGWVKTVRCSWKSRFIWEGTYPPFIVAKHQSLTSMHRKLLSHFTVHLIQTSLNIVIIKHQGIIQKSKHWIHGVAPSACEMMVMIEIDHKTMNNPRRPSITNTSLSGSTTPPSPFN